MAKKRAAPVGALNACCAGPTCRVEAVVSVDERGQMVLPKDLRTRIGIEPGEKLAVVSCQDDAGLCCVTLMKADDLSESVRSTLGPLLSDLFPGR
jgi:AbrB family looped-hinge helix DNA binding protein